MMFKHIFLTGENTSLKSEMINQLLKDKDYSGFEIRPYNINEQDKGHYLHSYNPVEGYDNDLPISVKMNSQKIISVPDVMDYFGAMIITNSLHDETSIIKMDYLALTNQKSLNFLEAFDRSLYSDKHIIGSLNCISDEISALVFTNNSSCILEVNEDNQQQMLENLKRIIISWDE